MERQSLLTKIKPLLSKYPVKYWVIAGTLFAIVLCYSLIFFIPKSIHFSYAQKNCTSQLALLPGLQKFNSEEFDASFEGGLSLGQARVLSTKMCVQPKKATEAGQYSASFAPFGGFIASKPVTIEVPEAPVARASDIVGKTISTSRPLLVNLTSADVIHQYSLRVAEKQADCEQVESELACDVKSLNLDHGVEYTVSLHQSYRSVDKKILEGKVETLQPLRTTASTIVNDQTIYDKPTDMQFTFDQPVASGEVSLVKVVGDATEKKQANVTAKDTVLSVSFGDLDREATYRLELTNAIGANGSSLAEPVALIFKTSGGPQVKSVSIGASGVSRSAVAVLTFDQPIDESVDIAKFARVEGISATFTKRSSTEVAFALKGGDCAAFSIIVDKGMKSGSNGLESSAGWKHDSRTTCGYSWTIGTSVKGRAIVAYSFGGGAKTILFTGGIHGSEPSSTTTMQAWVTYLQANAQKIPAGTRVVVVPNTNPDGIASGSRNNANNVNLGRNFPTANWSASIETSSGVLPQGGGTSAGSEPEAAALIALTRQLRPRLEVSFHARGSLVGANKYADSVSIGNVYASTVGYGTMYYNAEDVMGYAMTGEYEDWMGEEMNIPAILIELPQHSGNYLTSQLPALLKMIAL